MSLTLRQRMDRVRKRLIELDQWTARRMVPLDGWTFNGAPLSAGEPWPTRDGVVTLRLSPVTVPADWPLDDVRLDLDLGGEGLVRLAYDDGTRAAFALDPNHHSFHLDGRSFSASAECVARLPFGVPNRNARLGATALVWLETGLADFILLIRQVIEAADALGDHDAVEPMLAAAEQAFAGIDWPSSTEDYLARMQSSAEQQRIWQLPTGLSIDPDGLSAEQRASVGAAAQSLAARLKDLAGRYPQQGALAVTGHAHIDLAWLWPIEETRRKANRTFHTMIGLMKRYPDFRFNQSTAQLYAFLEEDDPELFAAIKERVTAGQWEPIGAMWVEPDTNMPTGESFVRQLLYGQRYFERTFGRRHTVCWLPDCFGFSPALPQLLKLAGVESFFTIKVNWSETNRMPFDLFWWEGLDGSRVLAHTFNNPVGGYNAEIGPRAAVATWRNFRGKEQARESLLSFGYGDGGGGPTEEMLERQRQLANFPAVPAMRSVEVASWFDALREMPGTGDLPTWVGEIYLELHRGTLTTQGRTKYLHRRAERALISAETLASMAALLGAPLAPSLEAQWRIVLRNQFHDILPGSSIREVYQRTEAELADVVSAGERAQEVHLSALVDKLGLAGGKSGLLVVNPDLSPRPLRIVAHGEQLPGSQPVEGGSVLCGTQAVPGISAIALAAATPPSGLSAAKNRLENDLVRVEIADDGTLRSLFDKRAGRETLDGRANQIWAYVDKPRNWDAWDVEDDYASNGEEIAASSLEIVEEGPHRAAIRILRRFRNSEIVQTVRLWANSARVEFKTDIDWHDRRLLVKARFPLAVRSDYATFECAHGVIRRATHRNTSWEQARFEVAAHRFVDLSEHGYGVALINDGKYGHHALGNELGISLLRSPVYPDPLADEGRQSFTYALYPHAGDWLSGGVLAEAEDLNQPLFCRRVALDQERTWTAVGIEGMQLGRRALKPAEDGSGVILRVYEPAGARATVSVTPAGPWSLSGAVDLLEEPAGAVDLRILPFKVQSWKLQPDTA